MHNREGLDDISYTWNLEDTSNEDVRKQTVRISVRFEEVTIEIEG